MSEEKTYVFGEPSSMDPASLLAMMNNGGFGNGSWIWIIFLFFLCGGRGIGNVDSHYGTDLLMQAINGNNGAVGQLATTLNSDINSVQTALNSVQSSIQSVGANVGLTGQQVINAIQSGNMTLASQLSSCCCENKLLACQNHSSLLSRIDQLANGITQGFSATAYETAQQTNALNNAATHNTNAIIAKLDSMENAAMQEKIASLTTQLNTEHQNATIAAMLSPLQAEIAAIKAAQPATTTVPYPNLTAVPTSYLYGYGPVPGSIWS